MYRPVLETGYVDEDEHEWLEVANVGDVSVDVTGWSFGAGLTFVFPERVLEPGDAVVITRSAEAFGEIHAVEDGVVLGEFEGRLSNSGERIRLLNADGDTVDEVEYSDGPPWPMGADALGVGDSWLPPNEAPEEEHRFRGRSLVRTVFDGDGDDPSHWEASGLDRETPGTLPPLWRTVAVPYVTEVEVVGRGPEPLPPGQPVVVRFMPSRGTLADLRVEWWVERFDGGPEPSGAAEATREGIVATATIPGQDAGAVVWFQVFADGGDGDERIEPRAGDPRIAHGFFVGEPLPGESRAYRLFIDTDAWSTLWANLLDGRVIGCDVSTRWNATEAAVFVWGSEVYDVRVRHQGSRYQRRNGLEMPWTAPGPAIPDPVKALSWRIAFPRYAPFDGMRTFTLNKLNQTCPGLEARVGFQLYGEAGIPAPRTRYARLFINGAYYNYTLEVERPGEGMYGRWHDERMASNPDLPEEPAVGDLHKAVGCACDEGPFGWADERLLEPHCGYDRDARYLATYDRKTHQDWAGAEEIRALIEGMHAARTAGPDALRSFLQERFDVPLVLAHISVVNWSGPWDDMWHNHYLYRRLSDGKWVTAPWDLDLTFGVQRGPNTSLYVGRQGDGANQGGWWNRTKDSFLQTFPMEYEATLRELNATVLTPENVLGKIDAATAEWDLEAIATTPAGPACDYAGRAELFRDFARRRHAFVAETLGP